MQLLRLVILISLCATAPVQADVEYIEVVSIGHGMTLPEAVNRALIEAIGQVQGRSVESDTQLITTEESVDVPDDASYYASEMYINKVREQTRGAVSKYTMLSSNEDERGNWEVKLVTHVAKYKKTASADRKRIAILPLRMSKSSYEVSGALIDAEDIRRRFGEVLVARLVQTRRFTILDREYTEETESELNLAASKDVPIEEQARLGRKLVADYVVAGTFEDLSYATTYTKMRMTGRTVTNGSGYIEIGYRLIDVALQQIAFSDTVRIPFSDAELMLLTGGRGGKQAIASSILDSAANNITKTIADQIYPMVLLKANGRNVVIGQGGNGIKQGTQYNVYQRGEKLYDPYTKEYLGRDEAFCCTVQIDRVAPKLSYGHITQNDVDLPQGFTSGTYVLRESVNIAKASPSGAKADKSVLRKKKVKNDDDW